MELLRAVEARYGIRADSLTKRWIGIRGYQDGGFVGGSRVDYAAGGKFFAFEAIDANGQEIKDILQAEDEEDAQNTIRLMGYLPTSIKPHKRRGSGISDRLGDVTDWGLPELIGPKGLFGRWFGGHKKTDKPRDTLLRNIRNTRNTEKKQRLLQDFEAEHGKVDGIMKRWLGVDPSGRADGGLVYAQHGEFLENFVSLLPSRSIIGEGGEPKYASGENYDGRADRGTSKWLDMLVVAST